MNVIAFQVVELEHVRASFLSADYRALFESHRYAVACVPLLCLGYFRVSKLECYQLEVFSSVQSVLLVLLEESSLLLDFEMTPNVVALVLSMQLLVVPLPLQSVRSTFSLPS